MGCIESKGWRQGAIVKCSDIADLLGTVGVDASGSNVRVIVASQSCDVANENYSAEPFIEVCLCTVIPEISSQYSHNSNPRVLHTSISEFVETADMLNYLHVELKAHEKYPIEKKHFENISPDATCSLGESDLFSFVSWLAARYSRPALPTKFNDSINKADPKKKLRSKVKKLTNHFSGIYVSIYPDKEIEDDETYTVQLLGLLPADFTGDPASAEGLIEAYAQVMKDAGMNVTHLTVGEDRLPVSRFRQMKRFYYDDLSYRDEAILPAEI